MWLTANVAYRLGAVLAVPASRLGMTPNVVSLISLFAAIGGAGLAVLLGYENWWAALLLFFSGHLAYGLDCADGVLARTTGRGSPFGGVLDKAVDTVVGIALPIILAIGALPEGVSRLEASWMLGALALLIGSRMSLAVSMWLREVMEKKQRTAEDARQRTRSFYVKQFAGNIVLDDVSFRTLLALAWGLGLYWELVVVLAVLLTLMLIVYLTSAKRQMGQIGP